MIKLKQANFIIFYKMIKLATKMTKLTITKSPFYSQKGIVIVLNKFNPHILNHSDIINPYPSISPPSGVPIPSIPIGL